MMVSPTSSLAVTHEGTGLADPARNITLHDRLGFPARILVVAVWCGGLVSKVSGRRLDATSDTLYTARTYVP